MLTRSSDLRKANANNANTEYYDLDMGPQLELESSASSDSGHRRVILQIIVMLRTILVQLGILKTTAC